MGTNALGGGQPKIVGMQRSRRRESGLRAKIEGRSPVRAALGQDPKATCQEICSEVGAQLRLGMQLSEQRGMRHMHQNADQLVYQAICNRPTD